MKLNNSLSLELLSRRDVKLKLALALCFSEKWVNILLSENKENGPLTTYKALQVIHETTGRPLHEILEHVEEGELIPL